MESKVKELALLREEKQVAKDKIAALENALREQHGDLYRALQDLKDREAKLTNEVKVLALSRFQEDGNKKPLVGIGIREMVRVRFSPVDALVYCQTKRTDLMILDQQGYKDALLSKAPDPAMPGEVYTEAIATVSPDLSAHLPDQSAAIFQWLDELQEASTVNMFEAPKLMAAKFNLTESKAWEYFQAWATSKEG